MNPARSTISLLALLALAPSCSAQAQEQEAPKARINITVTENGETKRLEREVPLNDAEAIQQALKEMGVLDEMTIENGANRIEINIRKRDDDGVLKDMDMSMFLDAPDAMVWAEAPGEPRAYLGVYSGNWNQSTCEDDKKANKNNTAVKEGACVTHVIEGTAAEKAGLKEGDVIVEIDGKEVKNHASLTEAIRSHKPGETVMVVYWRDGKKGSTTATLGEHESEGYKYSYYNGNGGGQGAGNWTYSFNGGGAFLGVVPGGTVDGGLQVEDVVDGSSAEEMGLQNNDVIKKLNGKEIGDFDDLVDAVDGTEPGAETVLLVERDGKTVVLSGTMGGDEPMVIEMPDMPEMPEMPAMPPMAPMYRMPQWNGLPPEYQEEMQREMEELRREMDNLREELNGQVRREMRIVIERRELTAEETELLRKKGVAGLDNKLALEEVRCFPNPSDGFFRLQFDLPGKGDVNVDVHDAKGERVYHESISDYEGAYERTLNLSGKPDGTYFLVITQNGKTHTQKLVKE